MRSSLLSRSMITVASLAVASAALAATPAVAAAPTQITRAMVLSAADGLRDFDYNEDLRSIVDIACDVSAGVGLDYEPDVVQNPSEADGVLLDVIVGSGTSNVRYCTVAAFAAIRPSTTLRGTATITGQLEIGKAAAPTTLRSQALSGDVFVTEPVDSSNYANLIASASGNPDTATTTTTSTTTSTPKTAKQKKAAKKTYVSKVKAAKKSYKRAIDKAGDSKSKKSKAKKTYNKKKSSAKSRYKKAVRPTTRTVTKTTQSTASRPFSITTEYTGPQF